MHVRMSLSGKKPTWTIEQFQEYWRDTHAPLAARIPNLRELLEKSLG